MTYQIKNTVTGKRKTCKSLNHARITRDNYQQRTKDKIIIVIRHKDNR